MIGVGSLGGWGGVQSVQAAVLVGGDAAEKFLAGDGRVLLGQGYETAGVGRVEKASGGDGASCVAESLIIQNRGGAVSIDS